MTPRLHDDQNRQINALKYGVVGKRAPLPEPPRWRQLAWWHPRRRSDGKTKAVLKGMTLPSLRYFHELDKNDQKKIMQDLVKTRRVIYMHQHIGRQVKLDIITESVSAGACQCE